MKNLSILIFKGFFFDLISLEKARQDFNCGINFSLIIINFEMALQEFLGKADLIKVQAFCIYEFIEVIIVNKEKIFVFAVFEVMAPSFASSNNG